MGTVNPLPNEGEQSPGACHQGCGIVLAYSNLNPPPSFSVHRLSGGRRSLGALPKMRAFVSIILGALLLAGCAGKPGAQAPPVLEASLGETVTLVGIAEARKGGAVLRGDTFYVWLKGVDFWPESLVKKRVEVRGRLSEDHALPVFVHDPRATLVPQGVPVPEGTDLRKASRRLIVEHATWRSVE